MRARRRANRASIASLVVGLVMALVLGPAGRASATAPSEDYHQSLQVAIADIQQFWAETFPAVYGAAYEPVPDDRIFAVSPGVPFPPCGDSQSYEDVINNAFYCTNNTVVYDDATLFPQLYEDYGGFALAMVLAHEWGHAVQDRAGFFRDPIPTVVTETQADCFAGSWTRYVDDGHGRTAISPGALDSAMTAMFQFRDDPGTDPGLEGAHGSLFDRAAAFQQGFDGGAQLCATYIATPPPIVEVPFADEQDAASGGNLPPDELINVIIEVLDAFYTQAEPNYPALTADHVRSYDSTGPKRQLPSCGRKKLKRAALKDQVFYCHAKGYVAFDLPFVTKVYDNIGDMGVATLFAGAWATYVETLQHFPGVAKHSDNAVLGADCYTGGFAAALNAGSLTSPTLDGNVTLSAGDLDETVLAFIVSASTSGAGSGADVTFARLRAFRDGFFNGFGGCAVKYSDTAISIDPS
jgi:predicted metalloprotease